MAARPEANIFTWAQLTTPQRQVAVDLMTWLSDFVGEPTSKPRRTDDAGPLAWQVGEAQRQSNVALIVGGGGSGRSSVLHTLLHQWRAWLADRPADVLGAFPAAQPGDEPIRDRVKEALPRLKGRLLPIRILDFRSLPADTALVPWIGAGIRELSERLGEPRRNAQATRTAARWQRNYESEPESKRAWLDLISGAAAGWTGVTEARKAVLDPEAYAEELKEADRARIDFGDSWRRFVDAVLDDASDHGGDADLKLGPSPCLVVPIEDVDANPATCRELLEVLRTLWHPRLAFLLTGSEALIVKTVEISYFGAFARLGAGGSSAVEIRSLIEVPPSPRRLAVDALDRAVPAAQRFAIQGVDAKERARLLGGALAAVIRRHETERHLKPADLAELLEMDPWAADALPPTPRRLQDVRARLEGPARDAAGAERVVELWLDAVQHSEATLPERRTLLQYMELRSGKLLRVAFADRLRPVIGIGYGLDARGRDLHMATVRSLQARAALGGGKPGALDRQLTSLVVLATDVASDDERSDFAGHSPAPDGLSFPSMANHLAPLADLLPGVAWREKIRCCWPLPEWGAPLDFAIFDSAWYWSAIKALEDEKAGRGDAQLVFLVSRFLQQVKGVATRRTPSSDTSVDLREVVGAVLDAARPSLQSVGTQTLRSKVFGLWAVGRGLLLAAPESGLPAEIANALLERWLDGIDALSSSVDLDEVRRSAWDSRVERLRAGARAAVASELGPEIAEGIRRPAVEKALEAIDEASSEYAFVRRLRPRSRS